MCNLFLSKLDQHRYGYKSEQPQESSPTRCKLVRMSLELSAIRTEYEDRRQRNQEEAVILNRIGKQLTKTNKDLQNLFKNVDK